MQHRDDDANPTDEPTEADATELDAGSLPGATCGGMRRERLLPGTIADAWELLRDAQGLERWLADRVDLVVEPGERGTLVDGDELREVVVEGVDEGRRLSLRWWTGDAEPSVVDLTLDQVDGSTRLVVTELPMRLVSAPATAPAAWTTPGGPATSTGPQLLAMAVR